LDPKSFDPMVTNCNHQIQLNGHFNNILISFGNLQIFE
jgi:hypothetical protein